MVNKHDLFMAQRILAALEKGATYLSDRFIAELKQYEDYTNVCVFWMAAEIYQQEIKGRFYMYDEDEMDYNLLEKMKLYIDIYLEYLEKIEFNNNGYIMIDEDEDDEGDGDNE